MQSQAVSWAEFDAAEPELAALVRRCFAIRKHATMATLRRDGSPLISGTEAEFTDDGLIARCTACGGANSFDPLLIHSWCVGH